MRKIFGIVSIFFVIMFSSCGKSFPCIDALGVLNFVSLADSATDSIILKKFIKDSGFTSLVDSIIITKNNSIYEKSNDTLHIEPPPLGEYFIDTHYDYEVYMPVVNRVFKITDIVQEQTEMNEGGLFSMDKRVCVNPLKSYKVNGIIKNTSLPDYTILYIND
jgi:hypothetical protein